MLQIELPFSFRSGQKRNYRRNAKFLDPFVLFLQQELGARGIAKNQSEDSAVEVKDPPRSDSKKLDVDDEQ